MTEQPPDNLEFLAPAVDVERLDGGGMILRSPAPLEPYAPSIGHLLRHQAETVPRQPFLAERDTSGGWRTLDYGAFLARVEGVAQALIDRRLDAGTPVMILSDNGIDNAILLNAAMYVGIPAVPVSPAYALMSSDYGKLRHIVAEAAPKLVYAADGAAFGPALAALDLGGTEVVVGANPTEGRACTLFGDLAAEPTDEVARRFVAVGPDTVAKILYTSGSTGRPKGVINTQRMLCSNQQAIAQVWPFVATTPPVLVDWLPWNHTFGGNHNLNMAIRNGGTLYIDAGKPAPGLIETTVTNLAEVSPTLYFNVPRGFDMLLPYLEADTGLRDNFFARLQMIFYAAAALPQPLWERLEALSEAATGRRVPMTSAWGATETAPMVTCVHYPIRRAGNIGLPAPGAELKMVPNAGKLEMRVRGDCVTPGYWKDPAKTAAAFDDDGFYIMGDAGKLADPSDPARGVVFDGRTAEDFKLSSGTWVHVGQLRVAAIAAGAPVVQDAVVTGHDRDDVGVLLFPNAAGCERVGDAAAVRDHVRRGLAAHNADNPASSTRITRAMMLDAPPDLDAGEITDKGYINQAAVLERRANLVAALYAGGDDVIAID